MASSSSSRQHNERQVLEYVTEHPVGLDKLVEDFERFYQKRKQKEQANILGILGMGGIGKSTLARELFNRKRSEYHEACFLSNVREASKTRRLPSLQCKLLKDLLRQDHREFGSREEGISYLKNHFKSEDKRFLIVLDDIDHLDQLEAFPIWENFGNSLAIVTTRDEGVLINAQISIRYKLKVMNQEHGAELFCWHAFEQRHPANGYRDVVKDFIDVCKGLPLYLRVLGRHIRGRNPNDCLWVLNKYKGSLHGDIKDSLKISLETLDTEEENVFMDMACFFVDKSKSVAIRVWEGSGWNAHSALEKLKEKGLVEEIEYRWNKEPVLTMHDLLRDLGRETAKDLQSPRRLWHPEHLRALESMGFQKILDSSASANWRCFQSIVDNSMGAKITYFLANSESLIPEPSLLWLELDFNQQPRECIPPWIPLQKLQFLKIMNGDLKRLWQDDVRAPSQLRELVISDCQLERFPNSIWSFMHLERISISSIVSSLPEEFFGLKSLEHLQLCDCVTLESLPSNFGDLGSLRYLDLSRCRNLRRLPVSFQYLMLLEYLNLQECGQLAVKSEDFQNMTKLEFLSLSGCEQVEELPRQIANQASFKELYLNGMKSLRELPINIGQLSRLRKMSIGSDLLTSLPTSLGDLSSLTNLQLCDCVTLESLPSNFGDLGSLRYLDLSRCRNLRRLPVSFQYLTLLEYLNLQECGQLMLMPEDFQNMTNLEFLSLSWCEQLEELPLHITDLVSLRELYLSGMKRLRELPVNIGQLSRLEKISIGSDLLTSLPEGLGDLKSLTNLSIEYCIKLESLPTSMGCLSSLTNLSIEYCTKLESLPTSMGDLSSLIHLSIEYCPNLESLPTSIGNLPSLMNLSISYCSNLKSLPTSMGCLSSLTNFSIEYCVRLKFLPTSLGDLSSLNDLSIVSCSSLKYLPTSMKNLSSLKNLSVKYCYKLESLPTSLGDLSSLTDLSIACCSNLKSLPTSLAYLRSLTRLSISECRKLKWLPFSESCFERLEDLAIEKCPISHVDFGAALSSFALSNLKQMSLKETEVHRISFSGDRYPRLESLSLYDNHNLTEIEELPTGVKIVLE